jgi:hypothetical protein
VEGAYYCTSSQKGWQNWLVIILGYHCYQLRTKFHLISSLKTEKIKYMLLCRHQNVVRNRDRKIANRSFENMSQFKYLGTTVTNQNLIQEEIKRRLNSGNACYHSVQNLLSSRLLIPFKYTCDRNWEFIGVTFSLCSQHDSARTGHLQVKYNYITYISWESHYQLRSQVYFKGICIHNATGCTPQG